MKVAFQGLSGSYSEAAAASMFSTEDVHTISCPSQPEIIEKVKSGEVDFGVVRFKHGDKGVDFHTVEALSESGCFILRECTFHEHYNLVGHPEATADGIKRVYAHPTIMHICRKYLYSLEGVQIVAKYDSAESIADLIKRGDKSEASVTGDFAAMRYGLNVLKSGIEDSKLGVSRFVAISAEHQKPTTEKIQTAVVFGLEHSAGSLFQALSVFKERGINIVGVVTQPQSNAKYSILVEFEGHTDDENVNEALKALNNFTTFFTLLGSYDSMEPRIP
ncbi:prephenate dehydratase domain-containing protein [Planctomycetota bacterium]|nr:prephenate dehydratase domain-containing protein [Planctomycetota bacterium]